MSGSHTASPNGTATATAARRPARDELDLLTPEDVARLLKVPTSTVYGLCREARIPHLKIGRRIVFERSTLREWVRSQIVRPEGGR